MKRFVADPASRGKGGLKTYGETKSTKQALAQSKSGAKVKK